MELVERYEKKYGKLIAAVGAIKAKDGPKGNGKSHLSSWKVQAVLSRMRGFEKCRGFSAAIDSALAAPKRTFRYWGYRCGGDGEVYHCWYTGPYDILDREAVPPETAPAIPKLKALMTEGDECCREDCDFEKDRDCEPCAPVYSAPRQVVRGPWTNEKEWCFERCSDDKRCETQGECDCSLVECRPCKGLKSLARYAAKEIKITLSFDICPTIYERFMDKQQRDKVSRQYCGIFDPQEACHINLDKLLIRGHSLATWSAATVSAKAFAGSAQECQTAAGREAFFTKILKELSNSKYGMDILKWTGKRVASESDKTEAPLWKRKEEGWAEPV